MLGLIGFKEKMLLESQDENEKWAVGQKFASHIVQVLNGHYDHPYTKTLMGNKIPKKRTWYIVGDFWAIQKNGKSIGKGVRAITPDLTRQIQFNWLNGNTSDKFDSVDLAMADGQFNYRIVRKSIEFDGKNGNEVDNEHIVPLILREINKVSFGVDVVNLGEDLMEGLVEYQKSDLSEALAPKQIARIQPKATKPMRIAVPVTHTPANEISFCGDLFDKVADIMSGSTESAKANFEEFLTDLFTNEDYYDGDGRHFYWDLVMDIIESVTTRDGIVPKSTWVKFKAEAGLKPKEQLHWIFTQILKSIKFRPSFVEKIKSIFELNKEPVEDQMKRAIDTLEIMISEQTDKYLVMLTGNGGLGKTYLVKEFIDVMRKADKDTINKFRVYEANAMTEKGFFDAIIEDANTLFVMDDPNVASLPVEGNETWVGIFKNACTSGEPIRSVSRVNNSTMPLYEYIETHCIKLNGKYVETDINTDEDGNPIEDENGELTSLTHEKGKVERMIKRTIPKYGSKEVNEKDLYTRSGRMNYNAIPSINTNFHSTQGDFKKKYEYYAEKMKEHYHYMSQGVRVFMGGDSDVLKDVNLVPFTGSIILITNYNPNKFDDVVRSRAFIVPAFTDIVRSEEYDKMKINSKIQAQENEDATTTSMHLNRFAHIYNAGGVRKKVALSKEDGQKIHEFIEDRKKKMNMKISSRITDTILEYATIPGVDWKKAGEILILQEYIGDVE